MQNPSVYAPRYFGYDPQSFGQGRTVRGAPEFWALRHNRLYLFHSRNSHQRFAQDPARTRALAGACAELARSLLASRPFRRGAPRR